MLTITGIRYPHDRQWFRVDKLNGAIRPVAGRQVTIAARAFYRQPTAVVKSGRFVTTFAIYSRADHLHDAERVHLSSQETQS